MWAKRHPGVVCGRQARPAGFLRARRGFTAVELVITLGIVAIFATLAMPSFVKMVRDSRLVTTAEMLQTDLLVARREAIKRIVNDMVEGAQSQW